jgi:hypothetical protein
MSEDGASAYRAQRHGRSFRGLPEDLPINRIDAVFNELPRRRHGRLSQLAGGLDVAQLGQALTMPGSVASRMQAFPIAVVLTPLKIPGNSAAASAMRGSASSRSPVGVRQGFQLSSGFQFASAELAGAKSKPRNFSRSILAMTIWASTSAAAFLSIRA